MLGKLFHYEWKAMCRTLLLPHLAVLAVVLAVAGICAIPALKGLQTPLTIFRILAMLLAVFIPAVTLCFIGVRYYQGLYTDQGYLTHTLPVTPSQLIFSRFFCGIIWIAIDIALVFISISLTAGENIPGLIFDTWKRQPESRSYILIFSTMIAISLLMSLMAVYAGISIGNLFSGHRILGSVAAYMGLYFLMQLLSLAVLLFFFQDLSALPQGNITLAELRLHYPQSDLALRHMCLIFSGVYLLSGAGLFFLTRYLVDQRLSLE